MFEVEYIMMKEPVGKVFKIRDMRTSEYINAGDDEPSELHFILEVDGFPYPLVLRMKGHETVDELIDGLKGHRRSIWGEQ